MDGYNMIGLHHVIDFPNHSRSYDSTRRAVRFWGHDSAIEASFFIDEDALTRIQPGTRPVLMIWLPLIFEPSARYGRNHSFRGIAF
jgi:hypothetical protein